MGRYVFKLPDVGEGTAEAEIVAWHVAVGDRVEEDQNLVDVMTDKATVEMTSPVSGIVVSLNGNPGDMAPVGAPLVELDVEGTGNVKANGHGAAKAVPAAKPQAPAPKPAPAVKAEEPAAKAPVAAKAETPAVVARVPGTKPISSSRRRNARGPSTASTFACVPSGSSASEDDMIVGTIFESRFQYQIWCRREGCYHHVYWDGVDADVTAEPGLRAH